MSDIRSSFERLMALFRYRGLDPGSLVPGQGKSMEALLEAGKRVAVDLEDLARRQAELIESSTRELMGSAQAMTSPNSFKEATQNNLKTLTNAADSTMHHLGELTQLLIEYNGEVVSALNRTVMASMNNFGHMSTADDDEDATPQQAAAPAAVRAPPARKAPSKAPARSGAAKTKRKASRRRKA